jgi:hypothetical protein
MITWTLAYRTPRANHFKRVTNWSGTWAQAYYLAAELLKDQPALQVYYVQTLGSELDEKGRLKDRILRGEITTEFAQEYVNDHGNILVAETKRRVKMRETGTLSDELVARALSADEAQARYEERS